MSLEDVKTDIIGAVNTKFSHLSRRIDELEAGVDRHFTGGGSRDSLREALEASAELKSLMERPRRGRVRIDVPGFFETKTTITSSAVGSSTPGILVPSRVPGIVKPGVRRNRMRDVLPTYRTSNNAVEYVKEDVYTSNASPQVEASAKEESALTFAIDYENVRTLAHWIPASRQVLDDMDGLLQYLKMRLIEGLLDEEDSQIVSGDATGQNLSGLTNEATAYDSGTYGQANDTKLDKLARMAEQLEAANLTAGLAIVHPVDWRLIQTQKTDDPSAGKGNYLMGGPGAQVEPKVWGIPVATTTAMPSGSAIVLDPRYVGIFDRMQATVEISTEHADFFTKNLVAIRAEERVAFCTFRSDAVVYASSF